jgi:hypothetical protein
MTDEELNEIEARANAATPGRWFRNGLTAANLWRVDGMPELENGVMDFTSNPVALTPKPENAAFIAHARHDVLALIAEARRLRDENVELRRMLREHPATIEAYLAVLAVLKPEHRGILDPDACGGRAPAAWLGASGWVSGALAEFELTQRIGEAALVLYDPRDPAIGRRGLAAAADVASLERGPQSQWWSVWWSRANPSMHTTGAVWVRLAGFGGPVREWDSYGVPSLLPLKDRTSVTSEVLALAVGAVLVHIQIAERIEEVTT